MPTQRPFLSNFLAAFRAHSQQLPKASPSTASSASVAVTAQAIWKTSAAQSKGLSTDSASSRPVHAKQAAATAQQERQIQHSLSPLQHNVSPATHLPKSPSSSGLPVYGPPNKPQSSYPTCQEATRPWADPRRTRRGSDSSSDSGGFREVPGAGWFVGGRTAQGEEKYYKLSMVKRERSADRISADRLSL